MSDNEQHELNRGLITSILSGGFDEVREYLDEGADANAQSADGTTALAHALNEKRHDVAQLLIDADADVNAKNSRGETALHDAALRNDMESVLFLLQHGAVADKTGLNAQGEIAEALNAQILLDTCLLNACEGGLPEDVRQYISEGANISARDKDGMTPLQLAVRAENYETALILLQTGADPDALYAASNSTALHYASQRNNLPLVRLLLEYGAGVGKKNMYGQTPIHLAAFAGNRNIVEALAETTPQAVLIRDYKNQTACDIACAQADKTGTTAAKSCVRYLAGRETTMNLARQAEQSSKNREQLQMQAGNKFRL